MGDHRSITGTLLLLRYWSSNTYYDSENCEQKKGGIGTALHLRVIGRTWMSTLL